ncbi:chitosanase [Streptomyces sp. TRM66268-LWL]|uniref:Chitosanase n=1 Tax=Streptomyces polyasparticus TaxID=2767826 RepID=A0ABR7SI43_9ACTN|nr:chitosanase [Streptomyces polyasparticus]
MVLAAVPAVIVLSTSQAAAPTGLDDPVKKEIAMQLVSSAENSSLEWKEQYDYIEDIGDGRGYTAGIVGFCSGTHDMLELVEYYTSQVPNNPLAKYLPALREVDGSDSHEGLDPGYTTAWQQAAQTIEFQRAQEHERDRVYFNPSVTRAKSDQLQELGQFIYYDAIVMHGQSGFDSIRAEARSNADTPAEGGDETTYLHAFLDARVAEMKKEAAHEDTSRVDTAQRVFLDNGNLRLNTPLVWHVYGDRFEIAKDPVTGPSPSPSEPGGGEPQLISKGKPVAASSSEDSVLTPDKAVDGNTSTRWGSKEGVDPQWIRIDLGEGANVSRVKLLWEAAYAKTYRVEISADRTTWTRLATETAGNGGTDDWTGLSGKGRYLRVYGTVRGTPYGYSLYEVEVYGTTGSGPGPTDPPTGAFTVVGAGDIADQCTASDSGCQHFKTADRAAAINPAFYITMGDNQYDDAHIEDFQNYYDKSWGRFKANTNPVPGNHESYDDYENRDEKAYREYFGSRATPQGKMWYSYNRGNWHFVALNSNRFDEQEQLDWLKADLAANTKKCVAAYWHEPLFSSGDHGNVPVSRPVWQQLEAAGAELVLNGHDHHYERFAPQTRDAQASPTGIVQIIGGAGGKDLYGQGDTVQPNSAKRIWDKFGVVKLDFTDTGFRSQFVDTSGTVLDTSPTYSCH